MSDPVTNVQIEDVLSSIRRLVSEEGRKEAPAEPAEPAPTTDRLVLTPALRVAAAEPAFEPESDPAPEEVAGEIEADLAPAEEVAGEIEADPALTEEDGAEPWHDPDATLFEAARAAETDDAAVAEEVLGHSDDADAPLVLEPVELAEAETGGEPPMEPASVETPDAEFADVAEPAEDAFEVAEADMPEADDAEADYAEADYAEAVASADARADSLSAKIEALEAAIGRTRDQWEPDGEGGDDYAGTTVETMEWRDHPADGAPRAAAAAPESQTERQTEPESPGLGDIDEAFLDEESLRELVADIVREELQGTLGERITRNVRKLVRREIHRALTAQELE